MLTKVEVYSPQGSVLDLPLRGQDNGYQIREIDGLNPVKANVVTSDFALLDGEEFQASSRESRNILIRLGLKPNADFPTIFDLRTNLYNYFMPKAEVNMRFVLEGFPIVEIKGYVETFETAIFSREPEIMISILNPQPDFRSLEVIKLISETTETPESQNIIYKGSVETGILFSMTIDRPISNFTINHSFANGVGSVLAFVGNLTTGDRVDISTVSGAKGAYLTRSGLSRPILYAISPSSKWINLYPGFNTVRVYLAGDPIQYTIEYFEKFGGL